MSRMHLVVDLERHTQSLAELTADEEAEFQHRLALGHKVDWEEVQGISLQALMGAQARLDMATRMVGAGRMSPGDLTPYEEEVQRIEAGLDEQEKGVRNRE